MRYRSAYSPKRSPVGADHGGHRIDHQLGAFEVGRDLGQTKGGHLEENKEVIAENHLDRGVSQERDLFGFVKVLFARLIGHANQGSASGASARRERCRGWASSGRLVT